MLLHRRLGAAFALGANTTATAAMMKAGAAMGATGENPVLVACRDADLIIGPIGIVIADSLLGEITPAMAAAIGQSRAQKILIPVSGSSYCRHFHLSDGCPGSFPHILAADWHLFSGLFPDLSHAFNFLCFCHRSFSFP